MLLFFGFNTSARYATIIGKKGRFLFFDSFKDFYFNFHHPQSLTNGSL